ncbi:MAG: FemAB family protein [Ponticaulis sp.]|nr:FemAB family protein [Ponticaulis sp.]
MSRHFTAEIDKLSRQNWDARLAQVPAAYQQDWAYGEVMRQHGAKVLRMSVSDPAGKPCALVQFVLRPFAMVGTLALASYGPIWLTDLSVDEKTLALKAIRRAIKLRWPRLVAITLDDEFSPRSFNRVMTGDATVRLDLTQSEDELRKALDGKWRNRLVAAEKSELSFTASGQKAGQYDWLLEEEAKQRQEKGYRGLPPKLTVAWQGQKLAAKGADKKAGIRIWRADQGREGVAAMMFLLHGAMATYHIGWSSEEGRKAGAHNLILWRCMLELKALGIRELDLGGVNTGPGAGIARFKLGTGGRIVRRSGVFV